MPVPRNVKKCLSSLSLVAGVWCTSHALAQVPGTHQAAGAGSMASKAEATQPASASEFPGTWAGRWKGEVRVLGAAGEPGSFTMERVIAPTQTPGRWQWTIIYDGAAGRQERAYELVTDDAGKGLYTVDEKNGIRIPSRYIDGVLYSTFEVQGSRIGVRQWLVDAGTPAARMEVELATESLEAPSVSGGGEAPEVRSWTPVSVQRATLRPVGEVGRTPEAARPAPLENTPAPKSKAAGGGRGSLPASATTWSKLATEPYSGKQDDVYFVSPRVGWYANGAGKIFKTTDAGATWVTQLDQPGTYWRCLAFIDDKLGFAGNIGPGYFPNVTDATPLYRTRDGGTTWQPVTTIAGDPVVGLCALEIVRVPFVNAGNLGEKIRLVGVGRVGGPAAMIVSDDLGETWSRVALPDSAKMAFDVHFFDEKHGVIASASSANVQESNALVVATDDGGVTWREAYRSSRPWEITWKISFPSRQVGYVTVQSYNPDPSQSARVLAKTTDGGLTWHEIPLVDDPKVREFGVAFLDDHHGFVGAMPGGFETTDGGATWSKVEFGNAVNKIRILDADGTRYLHAIGVQLHRLEVPKTK
ncbi:MAG: hypothetical protein GC200_08745 [Tepidisphaera sp.]|nr:hypothetical protein [Tepidisphaera sp.]